MKKAPDKTTIDQIKAHRCIRKFTDQPVDDKTVEALVTTAQCAATSHYLQAYSIIHVKDKTTRKTIAQLSGNPAWVEKAPVFLVFCADLTRLDAACRMRGVVMEKGWTELSVTATVDTALVGQNLLLAAESLGLGGVFIGGIRNDPETVCELLKIPDQAYPVFGMCLGWPAHDPPVKPRLPVQAVLFTDHYPAAYDQNTLSDYDKKVNAYYLHRNDNLREETWTGQVAAFASRVIRPGMKAFLEKKGFFLK
ncbi:oxygen-insensitive NADPH nitroreductase [Desulfosarcina sp. OttesenSCG-928-A07]|nr:oxygen-insensitive NADPH nitroreductase [Desulfosarcina sp. OttesenSCG-928-G17]MDL2328910.1 oxygen-insensitive NADPH nitroreductase [Desulfosarcina sp. OttesenSCG-928-A07]